MDIVGTSWGVVVSGLTNIQHLNELGTNHKNLDHHRISKVG